VDALTCREGHSLTGDEKLDVTGTPKCTECKTIRRKDYQPLTKQQMYARDFQGTRYRRRMQNQDPMTEHELGY
jgi:hypothetical protein